MCGSKQPPAQAVTVADLAQDIAADVGVSKRGGRADSTVLSRE